MGNNIYRLQLLCVALLFTLSLHAQDVVEVKRVPSDSLVSVIRHQCGTKIYFIKDADDVASFTISAPRRDFEASALNELSSKGYNVSRYGDMVFVTSGSGIDIKGLPTGFFDPQLSREKVVSEAQVNQDNQVVTFRNKVYEIGDPDGSSSAKAYVRGYVRDASSGEPLVGVAVYDDKNGVFAMTDASGFYRVSLPKGSNTLQFSGYSLDDLSLNLQVYGDGGLDVVMKEKVTSLKGAEITADGNSIHREALMGLDRVRANMIKKIPTAFGEADVLKVVLTLPGVKTVGEAATGFNVRGGASDQNLILFDEGTVFNPSHMFGLLSSFNTDVISEVELYKSSIPASYGGRISSVLDIHAKEGNSKKLSGSVGIGLLTSHLELEGPLAKDRTTFVLGARTTYSNWILGLLPEGSDYAGGSAGFNDLNLGITHKVNERNTLHAHAYWSRDSFAFSNDTTFRYSGLNASLKWRSQLSERSSMTFVAGYDGFGNSFAKEGLILDATASESYRNGYRIDTHIGQYFARLGFRMSAGRHEVSYGLQGTMYELNPGARVPVGGQSSYSSETLDRQAATEAVAYVSDAVALGDRFSIEYGTRLPAYFAANPSKTYLYPELRLSSKYSLSEALTWKAGFNSMSQNIHMISNSSSISPMDTWHLSSAKVRPQTGWQAASGLYWTVGDAKVDISLEGYYKRMSHYLDYKSGAVLVMNPDLEDWLVDTDGQAYGAELMIRKNSGKLNGWVSYTYSRTLLRESEDRGVETINGGDWYAASHDKPHDVKVVANYKLTHRVSFSGNLDYSTGRPVTLPLGRYEYNGRWYFVYSERNAYRIPDYLRLDLSMNVEPGHYLKQLAHMSFTLGVYNVTGRNNAYSVYYTVDDANRVQGHMLSVFAVPIPYVTLNLKF